MDIKNSAESAADAVSPVIDATALRQLARAAAVTPVTMEEYVVLKRYA